MLGKIKLENERYFRAFLDIVSNVWKSPIPFSAKTDHILLKLRQRIKSRKMLHCPWQVFQCAVR